MALLVLYIIRKCSESHQLMVDLVPRALELVILMGIKALFISRQYCLKIYTTHYWSHFLRIILLDTYFLNNPFVKTNTQKLFMFFYLI